MPLAQEHLGLGRGPDLAAAVSLRLWRKSQGSEELVEVATCFANGFALMAYETVQLAAAHGLQIVTAHPVIFACCDRRLNQAIQPLRLEVLA